jgi:hypothetical protein
MKHVITLRPVRDMGRPTHAVVATCSCGWRGTDYDLRAGLMGDAQRKAEAAGRQHVAARQTRIERHRP